MVAPGCSVDSTVTSSGYGYMCGTSMASPHVAGAAGLFFEYFRGLFGSDPSPRIGEGCLHAGVHRLGGPR